MRSRSKFTMFGDVDSLQSLAARTRPATRADRVFAAGFWVVVIGLVATRVVYFDPLYGQTMGFVAMLGGMISKAFG